MREHDSAIAPKEIAVTGTGNTPVGSLLAVSGVAIFSFTFPATDWALGGFGAWTTVGLRAVLAAAIAGTCLLVCRVPPPARETWPRLAAVAFGVVVGFPVLTTLALRTTTTSHAAVVVGALPLATAVVASAVTRTRQSRAFWCAATAGTAVAAGFAVARSHGVPTEGDLLLFASLVVCAVGYAAGGSLARVMPGWQVIGWALVGALPVTVPAAALAIAVEPARPTERAVLGVLYLAAVSQFLGLLVWYRGMALIGVARAAQFQLGQPLLTLVWSASLLGERLGPATPLAALAVLACVAVTQRA